MAFGKKKSEPAAKSYAPALHYCPKCFQKRFVFNHMCMTCRANVPIPKQQ